MKTNLVLFKESVIKSGLTYNRAVALLQRAEATRAGEHIGFHISRGPKDKLWKLIGWPRAARRAFINNPDDFVISLRQ